VFDLPDPSPAELQRLAADLVDTARPGDFNQALMELGALLCTPRSARCEDCPLGGVCLALSRGTVEERPLRRVRRLLPEMELAVLVAVYAGQDGRRFLLRRRGEDGLLAGMWEFPSREFDVGAKARAAAGVLARELGLEASGGLVDLPVVPHGFSHLKVRYWPFLAGMEAETPAQGARWVPWADLEQVPLPVAQRKIVHAAMTRMEDGGG
ncbi:NUDIX domain-containing protein, partial [Gemmatimonadota bacterium]